MAKGMIIYRGPSMLDGKPIVVVATDSSKNRKTGAMIQTWIIRDDISPIDSVKTGADSSICGDCPHRGNGDGSGRSCYVTFFQAPHNIWKTVHRGGYATMTDVSMFAGRNVRFGSYGDPAAVPVEVWERIARVASGYTGYTHQWRKADRRYSEFCMASCDSERDRIDAKAMGYRTFRVRPASSPMLAGEIVCPASEEAGKRRSCETCRACSGTRFGTLSNRAADITIIVHGSKAMVSNHTKVATLTIERRAMAVA